MGDAIGKAIADFDQKLVGVAEVGAGLLLLMFGLALVTGVGKTAVRTGVRVAKVIR